MKAIKSFKEYLNEGLRDKMTPKSEEDIRRNLDKLSTERLFALCRDKKIKLEDYFSDDEINKKKDEMIRYIVDIVNSKDGWINLSDLDEFPVNFDIKYHPLIRQTISLLYSDYVEVDQWDIDKKKRLPSFTVKYSDLKPEIIANIKRNLVHGLTPMTKEEIMNKLINKTNLDLYRLWKEQPESRTAICAFDILSQRSDKDITARAMVKTIKSRNIDWYDNFYKKK